MGKQAHHMMGEVRVPVRRLHDGRHGNGVQHAEAGDFLCVFDHRSVEMIQKGAELEVQGTGTAGQRGI